MPLLPPYNGAVVFRHSDFFKQDGSDTLFWFDGQGIKHFNMGNGEVWTSDPGGANPTTGNIRFNKTIGIDDASDLDIFTVVAFSGVTAWFPLDDTGRVEVTPRVRVNAVSMNEGTVSEEFSGVSSIDVTQRVRVYARQLAIFNGRGFPKGKPPKIPLMFTNMPVFWNVIDYSETLEEGDSWNQQDKRAWVNGFAPGVTKTLPGQQVPGTFQQGTSVLLEVGITYEHSFTANDEDARIHLLADVDILSIGATVQPFDF